ncbi:hypothetical protein [Lacticaseibacillus hulanensis]|uniref:hypothetical protein n=1 Tax=Lacticaseibacillus hulanensis TaxID=2493111 RepID=UPI000FDA81B7|nr:hypothetical protein [Lacticaseibacillus hulanensis]
MSLPVSKPNKPHRKLTGAAFDAVNDGIEIYYISKRLGHAVIQVTLSTYSHLLDAQRNAQAEKAMTALAKIGSQKVHNFAEADKNQQN